MAVKKKTAHPKAKTKAKTKAKAPVQGKAKPATKRQPVAMSEEAMMAQWQAAMTPSAGHARLMPMVGTWRATTTFTMSPDAPPQVHGGTSVHRLVLGG